jgi:phytoene/squalene synthetase
MEMDLSIREYNKPELAEYILGSAEAVGLMCLEVFCHDRKNLLEALKPHAMHLGASFQKINFLRDVQDDFIGMGRTYFPGLDLNRFDERSKKKIEESIKNDLDEGFRGIKKLPRSSRFGVYVAYVYYLALFKKIRNTPSEMILNTRISIRKRHKATLLAYSYVKHQLNLI